MPDFDIVFKGGVIYDGSGAAPLRGDVGIRGTRVAAIGAGLAGAEEINCAGMCVAPGFIDTHSHSDLMVFAQPALEMKLRQGVTLELLGQDGQGVAPLRTGDVASRREQLSRRLGDPPLEWSWRSVGSYLDALDQLRPALDFAFLVPHGAVRESLMGSTSAKAAPHDVFRMKGLLARSLDEGAFGMSLGPACGPNFHDGLEELVDLAGVAASRQVPCVVRLSSESGQLLQALEEIIRVARGSGAELHLSHLKISGQENWKSLDELIAVIASAQREGIRLTADLYPYHSGSCSLGALLPPWAEEGGVEATLARLDAPADRARIREEILSPGRCLWDNLWKNAGPEGIVIWDLPSGREPGLVGKSIAEAAKTAGKDPLDFALDLLRQERLAVPVVTHDQSDEVVEKLLRLPFVNVCSASLPAFKPHPRTYGAFPRVLARYVRDRRVLTLEAAIRKMTGLAADTFGLDDYGYLVEGKRANVVVFDPDKVADAASYEQPARFPEGIPYVMVGGKLVIRNGELTHERPGRVARRKRS